MQRYAAASNVLFSSATATPTMARVHEHQCVAQSHESAPAVEQVDSHPTPALRRATRRRQSPCHVQDAATDANPQSAHGRVCANLRRAFTILGTPFQEPDRHLTVGL